MPSAAVPAEDRAAQVGALLEWAAAEAAAGRLEAGVAAVGRSAADLLLRQHGPAHTPIKEMACVGMLDRVDHLFGAATQRTMPAARPGPPPNRKRWHV